MTRWSLLFPFLVLSTLACKSPQSTLDIPVNQTEEHLISFQFLQVNDVYEIAPIQNGKYGGMARLASLRRKLKMENPNTLTVLAGDFLSPSLIGTIKKDGKRIKGAQMIEAMNVAGFDLVTFGNHEFDIKEEELQARLNESNFEWLGTSVRYKNTKTGEVSKFYKQTDSTRLYVPDTYIWEIENEQGKSIKVGLFGATLNVNPRDYVEYLDYTTRALEAIQVLASQVDVIIGLTHLFIEQDTELAKKLPQVPLFMGGHEHHHIRQKVGPTLITKADANAKTAYVHRLTFNTLTKRTEVDSRLVPIDEKLASNEEVNTVVKKWKRIMDENLSKVIEQPYAAIYKTNIPLEARDKISRREQTNLGRIINEGLFNAAQKTPDCTFFNSGSMRLDDQLEGVITAIDVFRVLPFGGSLVEMDISGDLLIKVLEESESKIGKGAYLQRNKVWYSDNKNAWVVQGEEIEKDKTYHIVTTDYLLLGIDLTTLHKDATGISNIEYAEMDDKTDLRRNIVLAVVEQFKTMSKAND